MVIRYLLGTFAEKSIVMADIKAEYLACPIRMLSQTLKNLEQSHLVHREVYPEVPPRVEYSLTETGKSLMPAIIALIEWGQAHFKEVVTD